MESLKETVVYRNIAFRYYWVYVFCNITSCLKVLSRALFTWAGLFQTRHQEETIDVATFYSSIPMSTKKDCPSGQPYTDTHLAGNQIAVTSFSCVLRNTLISSLRVSCTLSPAQSFRSTLPSSQGGRTIASSPQCLDARRPGK